MFDFKDEDDYRDFIEGLDEIGSVAPVGEEVLSQVSTQARFRIRQKIFRENGVPLWKHHFWWFVHNCITHPCIGICPMKWAFDFHDFTSRKLMNK